MRPTFRVGPAACLLCLALAVPGCSNVTLYSNLPESDINEMMAVLQRQGIDCAKEPGTEGTWTMTVPGRSFAEAVRVINAMGYPRPKSQGISESFQKSGLVSSPTEERIRFMAALSHELEETFMRIDGVVAARVHVVLPENDPLNDRKQPAKASVLIKHLDNVDVSSRINDIKGIVTHSLEGLQDSEVAVYFVATQQASEVAGPAKVPAAAGWGAVGSSGWGDRDRLLLLGLASLVLLNLVVGVVVLRRGRGRGARSGTTAVAINPAPEPAAVARAALTTEKRAIAR
jgi:type III secretion protein J